MRPRVFAVSFVLLSAVAGPALAQGNKDAIAEGLFREAKRLLERGEISAACQKFKASLDTDRASGTLTALAFCHQKEGRTASAWAEYSEVEAEAKKSGRADQEKYAREQVAALDKVLRKVTITAAPTPGLVVAIDGTSIPPAALGTPLPVDPGERHFTASATGYKSFSTKVEMAPGPGETPLVIPRLEIDPTAARVLPNKDGPVAEQGLDTTKLFVGAGAIAVGGVALGVGGYMQFVVAKKQQDDADFLLQEGYDQSGHDEKRSDALLSSTIGITGLALGGVALLAGVYLVVTSFGSKPARASGLVVGPMIGAGTAGASVGGTLR